MGFSIRTLLLIVGVAAICAAAILRQSALWASAMVSLYFCFCVAGTIVAWLRPARRRFWVPFCLAGWPFFFLALVDSRFTRISTELITSRLIYELWYHNYYEETLTIANEVGFTDFPRKSKEEVYYMIVSESLRHLEDCVFFPYQVRFRVFYFTLQSIFGLALSTLAGLIVSYASRPAAASSTA